MKIITTLSLLALMSISTYAHANPVLRATCSATFEGQDFTANIIRDDSGAAWNLMKLEVSEEDVDRVSLHTSISFNIKMCDQDTLSAIHCINESSGFKREMSVNLVSGKGLVSFYDGRVDWFSNKVYLENCKRSKN